MHVNLLSLFTFYLAAMFLLSTYRRLRQYHDVAQIAVAAPQRWPKVMQQIKKHWFIFMSWTTLRPAALAIGLLIIQMICSRVIWPQAKITLAEVLVEWWLVPGIFVFGVALIGVDLYFIIRVGQLDRRETEKYLDEAEHWLTSWKAPVINAVTFGYVNPRQMVDVEVQKALADGRTLLQRTLWWVSIQAGLRVTFGLILWLSWALYPGA